MTALLEFKQKIKGLFAQYEVYMMPFFKFVLALVYFVWINSNMGYMRALDNIFVVLILALICSVLPTGMIVFTGCVMMTVHCYALGIEVAGFMLVILLFMLILFLRFSAGKNIVMVFTPLACAFDLPALLPIGCRPFEFSGFGTPGRRRSGDLLFCTLCESAVPGAYEPGCTDYR